VADVIGYGVVALAVLVGVVLLWPTPRGARRLLVRWGVSDPTDAEVTDALTYLRRRRIWYPPVFLAGPALVRWLSGWRPQSLWSLLGTLLLGALLAELLAQRPTRRSRREASLEPRRVRDLVPGWALAVLAVAATAVVLVGAVGLFGVRLPNLLAVGDSDVLAPHPGIAAAGAVATVLAVSAVLWLSVRRPPSGQPRSDAVLRIRSGRVATGLGVAALCALAATGTTFLGLLVTLVGLVAWRRLIASATNVVAAA
jgi:hypothetical protein